ncbi:MAG: extracellular solute-binding protein [Myxococcales bacterium]|nr:extracellular solute-binding protein [Myxococcales bacterium]
MKHPPFARLAVLASLAVFLFVGLFGFARPAAATSKTPILVWHSYTGEEQKVFETLVEEFNARQSAIDVKTLRIPYDVFADKLTSAMGVDKGPDLFVFAHDRVGYWADQGRLEPLQHALTIEDLERYTPAAIDALTYPQGSRMLYGLPMAMKAVALVYDKARVPRPPKTLDELIHMAQPLTGNGSYGFVSEWASTFASAGFLHAFGGGVLTPNGVPNLNNAKNAEALAFLRQMLERDLLPREVTGAMVTAMFNDGRAAMIITGPWSLGDFKKDRDIGVAPLPQGPADWAKPYLSVEALMVNAASKNKASAIEVLRYLTGDASAKRRLEQAGQPVANRAAWEDYEDARLLGFREQAEHSLPMPSAPAMRHVWTPMDATLIKVVSQGADPDAALEEAQRRVKANAEQADKVDPIETVVRGAEKAYERLEEQRAHPETLLPDSRWEAAILTYLPSGQHAALGQWCGEGNKVRGFSDRIAASPPRQAPSEILQAEAVLAKAGKIHDTMPRSVAPNASDGDDALTLCRIDKAIADLADLAIANPDRPAVMWNAAKTEVTLAKKIDDGRVALIRSGAPIQADNTWTYVLVALLLAIALAAFAFRKQLAPHLGAYAYVAPAIVAVVILTLLPFGYGITLAFKDVTPTRESFVGLKNFADILLARGEGDPHSFYYTAGMTIVWTFVNVAIHVCLGLFLALLLQDNNLKGKNIYRVLLIIPWAVPNYITALIWKAMFNAQYGFINNALAFVGLEGFASFSWFNQTSTAFLANLATNVWLGFPFMMVTALGALQSIPKDLYEAADVDGAGRWMKFRTVTLPLLKPALFPAIILGAIWTFNLSFNVIYLVSGGAPDGATDILVTQVYRYAFEQYRYGYAAAYATLIFLILVTYTVMTNRITKATEGAFE